MYILTDNYQIVKNLFTVPHIDFVLESIIEGFTPATIYVNRLEAPSVALIWDHHHLFYLGGDTEDRTECQKAVTFIKEQLLDEEVKQRLEIGKFCYTTDAWEAILLEGLAEWNPGVYWRCLYRHSLEQIPEILPPDLEIALHPIDQTILLDPTLINRELMIGEIRAMWGDPEKFLKHGFGSCAIREKTVLCWCTGEYFSKEFCGTGIETVEEYTGKGIATMTAVQYLNQCTRYKKIPHWDSWKNNIGSIRVAEKVGFVKVSEYKVIFVNYGSDV